MILFYFDISGCLHVDRHTAAYRSYLSIQTGDAGYSCWTLMSLLCGTTCAPWPQSHSTSNRFSEATKNRFASWEREREANVGTTSGKGESISCDKLKAIKHSEAVLELRVVASETTTPIAVKEGSQAARAWKSQNPFFVFDLSFGIVIFLLSWISLRQSEGRRKQPGWVET